MNLCVKSIGLSVVPPYGHFPVGRAVWLLCDRVWTSSSSACQSEQDASWFSWGKQECDSPQSVCCQALSPNSVRKTNSSTAKSTLQAVNSSTRQTSRQIIPCDIQLQHEQKDNENTASQWFLVCFFLPFLTLRTAHTCAKQITCVLVTFRRLGPQGKLASLQSFLLQERAAVYQSM